MPYKVYHNVLSKSCETLAGVGPTLAVKLAKCGIHTLQDLLFHLPYRYQDRTRITPIQDLRANDWCVVSGRVCRIEIKKGNRMSLFCHVEDKTGILMLRFFHFNQQQVKKLQESPMIRAFGEVKLFANVLQMIHPEYQLIDEEHDCVVEEHLTPIYPGTQGLTQTRLRKLIQLAWHTYQNIIAQLEWMSDAELAEQHLMSLPEALAFLHMPPPDASLQALEHGTHPAMRRLIVEELLAHQLSMQFARKERQILQAPILAPNKGVYVNFLKQLPFELTSAQHRVALEISNDLKRQTPMLRLVQGDVGAGKTVIAAIAAIQAIANGYQVAFMAPTDILSEQHAQNLEPWLKALDISIFRLSGKMTIRNRRTTLEAIANHQCQLLIGTHALFQKGVDFAKLGLIIIDEQHRFGVEQRLSLQKKGRDQQAVPHQLLMTATPIPRTLAMSHFTHMDLSVLDELPPGRTPVITAVLNQNKRTQIIARLKIAIANGRQVYWVCTLIESSEKLQCIAATATKEQLQQQLPHVKIGLVHGRLKIKEKENVMHQFKQGDIDLLVATTVIEVGVDVANASLMIIENAERLGLSQLHQLRGRIGRGCQQSHCLLLYQSPLSKTSAERLKVMRDHTDGFLISEKDLELRGAGEILGTRQTGYRQYKIADLQRDKALLSALKPIARALVQQQPETAKSIANRWLGDFETFLQG